MAVMKKLLVVESPTKAKTISRYLGADYKVVATVGHLRDLPKNKMGVDLAKDYEIEYIVDAAKSEVVSKLLAEADKAGEIYLATDPDREGEAIAWHVDYLIKEREAKSKKKGKTGAKIRRVVFHEITKEAVEEAVKNPREIDLNLVDAQQGRRVLDRVVGYSLSPLLWRKVRRGLSAGRVQSVAVRLICEREREIEKFIKEKFVQIKLKLQFGKVEFGADLVRVGGKNIWVKTKTKLFDGEYVVGKTILDDKKKVDEVLKGLGGEVEVTGLKEREISRTPLPAFTTSKMQQAAARMMGWSGKQTMRIAQRLYEQGLITYHRTDSVYLSDKAIADFRKYIGANFGEKYLAAKVRVYKNRSKNAQEAHEAIRPTKAENKSPPGLEGKEEKLYRMIWKRAVATQAAAAVIKTTKLTVLGGKGEYEAGGLKVVFDGFMAIAGNYSEEQILPGVKIGDRVKVVGQEEVASETNLPPRYSDASLVGSLEKQGIGRPSTYAPIISTIILRQYVEKNEGRFVPTKLGLATNDFLVGNFSEVMSLPFTAGMEEDLDRVAMGKGKWKKMIGDFWGKFEGEVKKAQKDSQRVKVEADELGEKCPECKVGELVVRIGRFGKFISCGRFPECKYKRQFKEEAGFNCPQCGKPGVVRRTKTGRKFYGCSAYPGCKWASWKRV